MRWSFCVFLILINSLYAQAQLASSEEFASPDRYSLPAISPDGAHLALLEFDRGKASIGVYALSVEGDLEQVLTAQAKASDERVFAHDAYLELRWITDTRLLIRMRVKRLDRRTAEIHHQRFFKVLDLEAGSLKNFLAPDFTINTKRPVSHDYVLYWPERSGEQLLMVLQKSGFTKRMYRVDPTTGKENFQYKPPIWVYRWITDQTGKERIRYKGYSKGRVEVEYRKPGENKWRELKDAKEEPGKVFTILEFSPDPALLYVISNHEQDVAGLYLYDLQEAQFSKKVAVHPKFDVESIQLSQSGELEQVVAVSEIILTTDRERRILDTIAQHGQLEMFNLLDRDRNDHLRVYALSSSDDPGGFYLLDTQSLSLIKLKDRRSESEQTGFGATSEWSFLARDGLELDAYLALPHGLSPEEAENLPFVLMPHGGPWARDFAVFDNLTQFITSLGYGVLKVNFRGSSGYGTEFEELGVGEWGKAMQLDLDDALDWAIAERWIDPDRVCIVGWSYGGYASLMASIESATRYKCAGSIAGVTDLVELIKSTQNEEVLRRIGAQHSYDKTAVIDVSPKDRAAEIAIPIFLAHGTGDRTVNVFDHYQGFLKTLKRQEKEVDAVAFLHGDHSLSAPADRKVLYDRLGAFLNQYLEDSSD